MEVRRHHRHKDRRQPARVVPTREYLTNVGGTLYFCAYDGADTELWRYDGTTATKIDINAGAGSSCPSQLTDVTGTLYLNAYVPAYGNELWFVSVNDAPWGTSCLSIWTPSLEIQPADTLVGTLATSDPDTGDTFSYALIPGQGDADNDRSLFPNDHQ